MSHSIALFGEVLFDVFPDKHQVLGGAPFNVAWHLQAFGQHPLIISRVGSDPQAEAICQAMEKWGMDSSGLQRDQSLPTGKVTIQLQDGEPTYDIVFPSAWDEIDAGGLKNITCKLFYHGSLAARNAQSASALDTIISNRPECIFIDVNLRTPWWDKETVLNLMRQAHWAKLNSYELDLLYPGTAAVSQRLADFITNYSLEGVILTLGKNGAEVMTKQGEHYSVKPESDISVVDTVGAGDAFSSVMIMGLTHAWPMQTTVNRAQAFASSIVGQRGATVSDPAFYKKIMSTWI